MRLQTNHPQTSADVWHLPRWWSARVVPTPASLPAYFEGFSPFSQVFGKCVTPDQRATDFLPYKLLRCRVCMIKITVLLNFPQTWGTMGIFFHLQSQMISSLATNNPPTLQQQTVLGGCWKDEEMHQQLKIYHISVSKCLKLPDLHYIFCLVVYLHHPNRFKQCPKFTQYNGEFHLVACRQMKLTVIFFWSAVFLRLHSCSDPIPWVSFTLCVWKCCYFHY